MNDSTDLLQCIVLPKGFAGEGLLRITLVMAPAPTIEPSFNLPDHLRGSLQTIDLKLGSDSDPAGEVIGSASLSPDHWQVIDAATWAALMPEVRPGERLSRAEVAGPGSGYQPMQKPAGAAWNRARSVEVLQALGNLAMPAAATSEISKRSDLPRKSAEPLRRGLRIPVPAARQARGIVDTQQHPLSSALEHVNELFSAPGDAIDSMAEQLERLVPSAEDEAWLRLLAARVSRPDVPRTPRGVLLALGLRPTASTVLWLRERMQAAAGRGGARPRPFGDALLDHLLFTAPHLPHPAAKGATPLAQPDDDQAAIENRLAAMGGEFVLHPMLGLAVDLVFACNISDEALRQRLNAGNSRLQVVLGKSARAHQPWTLVDGEAWPKPRRKSVFDPASSGWCSMTDAWLSDRETPNNLLKWTSTLLDLRNRRITALHGMRAVFDTVTPPPTSNGHLVMYATGLGAQSKYVAENGHIQGASDDVLGLEDLVIGIRPTLELTDKQHRRFRRALLDRSVTYPSVAYARREMASSLEGVNQGRDEGYIPVVRMSEPGEKSPTRSMPVGTDQVFEWSGWNPSVPFPGAPPQAETDLLQKTIVARPGGSLPYRYGLTIRAACRWVLRDGSSRIPATQVQGLDDAPWIGDGSLNGGYRLQRYEPLRAPMAMWGETTPDTNLVSQETATQALLATRPDGRVAHGTSVRYILPGAIRDLIELDRHAVFDGGVSPRASAYAGYARATTKDDAIFPSIERHGRHEYIFKPREDTGPVDTGKLYHPDPLTVHLRLQVVRALKDSNGPSDWYPVHDTAGRELKIDVPLYAEHPWPDACALRVTFQARPRTDVRPTLSWEPARHGVSPVAVGVPAGESFALMVIPTGDPKRLRQLHANGGLEDGHPSLANMLVIDVQHVVQQPYAPTLRSITAAPRNYAGRVATLAINGAADSGSTTGVDLHAAWTDPVDDPTSDAPPQDASQSDQPKQAMVVALLGKQLGPLGQAQLPDATSNMPVRPPLALMLGIDHEFPDTRHRRVGYRLTAVGSPVLADQEAGGSAVQTQDSERIWARILASAPPRPPKVREIELAFRFDRESRLSFGASRRNCALRVVMERGWWSSGPGELLAIAVAPVPGPDGKTLVRSTWAADPIRRSLVPFGPELHRENFVPTGQRREGPPSATGLVLYEPTYDAAAGAWRVDVELRLSDVQIQPFVQLVLARYQPNAIGGAQMSPVVIADYFQLPSNRSATVTFHPGPSTFEVVVHGPVDINSLTPAEAAASANAGVPRLRAVVQRTERAGYGAAVWLDTPCEADLEPDPSQPQRRQFASIAVPPRELRGNVRVAIVERTLFDTGMDHPSAGAPVLAHGPMHYFDVIALETFEVPQPG